MKITIQATKGFGSLGLKEVWEYRDLLWFQVMREVKGKYRQMALGPLWIILQPVINMVLFSIIFGTLARFDSGSVPYPVFAYVGLLPWQFFQTTAQRATGCLIMRSASTAARRTLLLSCLRSLAIDGMYLRS